MYRDKVYNKCGGRCAYCGKRFKKLEIDHLIPLSAGGSSELDNLLPACSLCNRVKKDLSLEEFKDLVRDTTKALRTLPAYNLAKNFGLIEERSKDVVFYFERNNK